MKPEAKPDVKPEVESKVNLEEKLAAEIKVEKDQKREDISDFNERQCRAFFRFYQGTRIVFTQHYWDQINQTYYNKVVSIIDLEGIFSPTIPVECATAKSDILPVGLK